MLNQGYRDIIVYFRRELGCLWRAVDSLVTNDRYRAAGDGDDVDV